MTCLILPQTCHHSPDMQSCYESVNSIEGGDRLVKSTLKTKTYGSINQSPNSPTEYRIHSALVIELLGEKVGLESNRNRTISLYGFQMKDLHLLRRCKQFRSPTRAKSFWITLLINRARFSSTSSEEYSTSPLTNWKAMLRKTAFHSPHPMRPHTNAEPPYTSCRICQVIACCIHTRNKLREMTTYVLQ